MPTSDDLASHHARLSRRHFVELGVAAVSAGALHRASADLPTELAQVAAGLEYLTPADRFLNVSRGTPPPNTLSEEERRAAGLTRDTWRLEVVPDPESDAEVANPLSIERGTALAWDDLMALAEEHAVCFPHVVTCLNMDDPCGMGLWEGVPLRVVVWQAQPVANVRRVFYHGYHNNDPAQMFRSSLPLGRVLEDPPGEPPVLLCTKLNGEWLSPDRGGPVRLLVPNAYGFKSVKWLQRVVLTNHFQANDTYAEWNNDVDTSMKTFARFLSYPESVPAGEPIPITGLAQVGAAGLARVQVCVWPDGQALPPDDPYLTGEDWMDADILGPPEHWGGNAGDRPLPMAPLGFDAHTNRPSEWPMRFAIAHWAILLPHKAEGAYELRCRTIDAAGHAQPMPRPFPKSGRNAIQRVVVRVG